MNDARFGTKMKTKLAPEVESNLAALRQRRGFSAAWLAKAAGVSRQTIYAIEAGSYIPNTAVALKLAQVLETKVEELFALPESAPVPVLPTEQVMLLPGSDALEEGQPVQLCRVEEMLVAWTPSPLPWAFPASDAIVTGKVTGGGRKVKVQVYRADEDFKNRILVAGCDPGISVLANHVRAAGIELVVAQRNSTQSLALLKEGAVHLAGTHLRDQQSGESNLPEIARLFPQKTVAVISFAVWEEGIVTARGNPKGIRGVEDFARKEVRMVNREKGAGSRLLLDSHLERLKIDGRRVSGYGEEATGHLAAAWQVRTGGADCCVATRAAARVFGLSFIPLVTERYDFALRRKHLELPGIQVLLDTLNRATFRRELENLGGYDTRSTGQRML